MNKFEEYLRSHIAHHGPVDIGEFMGMAMGHPQYGYYATRDPFGQGGDFITSPEISQMFGELWGMWLADVWMKMGSPSRVYLVECGPGRGTLMSDILRVAKQVPNFYEALKVYLVEISPVLKSMQAQVLRGHEVHWLEGLSELPDDGPVFVIGNELLDALPMRQFLKTEHGWGERVVSYDEDKSAFVYGYKEASSDFLQFVKAKAQHNDLVEFSPARSMFWQQVCERVRAQGGAALFADYGYYQAGAGDSLQAVKGHEFVNVLQDVGDSDLSSHVDFGALVNVSVEAGVRVAEPTEQRDFLQMLGILNRAHALKKNATDVQKQEIEQAVERLIGVGQFGLGKLFKVIAVCSDDAIELCGFSSPSSFLRKQESR